jgi:WD40 repeat protein
MLELWDVTSGRRRSAWRGHVGTVGTLAFSPDGRTLVSGGADAAIRMWDVSQHELEAVALNDF